MIHVATFYSLHNVQISATESHESDVLIMPPRFPTAPHAVLEALLSLFLLLNEIILTPL